MVYFMTDAHRYASNKIRQLVIQGSGSLFFKNKDAENSRFFTLIFHRTPGSNEPGITVKLKRSKVLLNVRLKFEPDVECQVEIST